MKVRLDSMAWLDRKALNFAKIVRLERELTLQQRKLHPQAEPQTLRLWESEPDVFGVPRAYFLERARLAHQVEDRTTRGQDLGKPIAFEGQLRPGQLLAFRAVMPQLEKGYGGVVRAPTGWGKTVWACAVVAELGVPALVFVQRESLTEQWVERLEQFLPDARIGVVQGDRCDHTGFHVSVAMMQSVSQRDNYPQTLYDWPGLLIFDEVHRLAAPTFSQIPPRFPARWRLGLSATPRRADGTEDAFFFHLGGMLHSAFQAKLTPKVKRVWTRFRLPPMKGLNERDISEALLLRFLCTNPRRNAIIVDQLVRAVAAGRRCLVLSKRLQHLDDLEELFQAEYIKSDCPPTTGFCIGGVRGEKLAKAKQAQVIFATYSFAGEGFDVPELDTLVMATPIYDSEQPVGRILREHEGKKHPIVVDLRDDHIGLCERWGRKRDEFYESLRQAEIGAA